MPDDELNIETPYVCQEEMNRCIEAAADTLHDQMMELFGDTKEIINDINGEVI